MAGSETATFGIWRCGKDFADGVEGFEIGGGIRTRSAADGRLIDDDYLTDVRVAFQTVTELLDTAAGVLGGQGAVEHIVHECGLARAADAGDNCQSSQR